jgi:hypothetical protein
MRQAERKAWALESEIKYPRPEGTQVEIVNQPAENVAHPHVYSTHMWSEGFTSLPKRGRCASLPTKFGIRALRTADNRAADNNLVGVCRSLEARRNRDCQTSDAQKGRASGA